jgi:dTDP-4-dehydrorhamnose 3,5-epimerase
MEILEVKSLEIPEVKAIRFKKFRDARGYFAEHFKKSDFAQHPKLEFLHGQEIVQANESYSEKGVIRGMHFQWAPPMGKLVRNISGHMTDLILDIRKSSPTYGKMIAYDLPDLRNEDFGEWIYLPSGFAHGFFTSEDTTSEYLCSAEYNPKGEAGISPFSPTIDWSLCDPALLKKFQQLSESYVASEKDKKAVPFSEWGSDPRSENYP